MNKLPFPFIDEQFGCSSKNIQYFLIILDSSGEKPMVVQRNIRFMYGSLKSQIWSNDS